jgi:hypothetical protein
MGIAGMPAFLDPKNPQSLGGSVNYGYPGHPDLEDHPMEHAESYGASEKGAAVETSSAVDENRDDWTLEQWKDLAREYDLPVSGTKDEVVDRVETYEADQGGEQ